MRLPNESEVLCNLTNLLFNGTLTITLPSTTMEWLAHQSITNNNNIPIPLRIFIINGRSRPLFQRNSLMWVTGTLSSGSSIIIQGGNYLPIYAVLHVANCLTVEDGSMLIIAGGSYGASFYGTIGAVMSCACLTVRTNGSLSISNNDVEVYSVADLYMLSIYNEQFINTNGTISVSNIVVLNAQAYGDLNLGFVNARSIYINTPGTLSISNNSVVVPTANVESWSMSSLNVASTATVATNGTLSVAGNCWNISRMGQMYTWKVFTVSSYDSLIDTFGTFSISDNSMIVSDVQMVLTDALLWSTATLSAAFIVINNTGTLSVAHNSMIASDAALTDNNNGQFQWSSTTVLARTISIHTASNFSVAYTNVSVSNVILFGSGSMCTLSASVTVSTDSTASVSNNDMYVTDFQGWDYRGDYLFTWSANTVLTGMLSGTLTVFNNGLVMRNMTFLASWSASTLLLSSGLAINSGILSVSNNSIIVSDMVGIVSSSEYIPTWTVQTVYSTNSNAVSTNGTLSVANNNVSASRVSRTKLVLYLLYAIDVTVDTISTLSVSNNIMVLSDMVGLFDAYHRRLSAVLSLQAVYSTNSIAVSHLHRNLRPHQDRHSRQDHHRHHNHRPHCDTLPHHDPYPRPNNNSNHSPGHDHSHESNFRPGIEGGTSAGCEPGYVHRGWCVHPHRCSHRGSQ